MQTQSTFSGVGWNFTDTWSLSNSYPQLIKSFYTVTFVIGSGRRTGGGALTQSIGRGGSASVPVLTPPANYNFTGWDVTFSDITSDLTVTAVYERITTTYTVIFNAGAGGSISGEMLQTIMHGMSTTTVTAVPQSGYKFDSWSDGMISTSRSVTNVTANLSFTANFVRVYNRIPRYRLYNPNDPKHHFTTDLHEYNVLATLGWLQEGVAYYVYKKDELAVIDGQTAAEFYRLYNPNEGRHLWTTSAHEYNVLATYGWSQEGVDSRIFLNPVNSSTSLYRLYNPNEGKHLWTVDAHERGVLLGLGWLDEGVTGMVFQNQ